MDDYFGLEQWEYQLLTRRIGFPVNFLPEADAIGTPIEYEEDEQDIDEVEEIEEIVKLEEAGSAAEDEE